jgi:hypothetical protein
MSPGRRRVQREPGVRMTEIRIQAVGYLSGVNLNVFSKRSIYLQRGVRTVYDTANV